MSTTPLTADTPGDQLPISNLTNDITGSSSLLLLPPSPTTSTSSLTSDETAFDHLATVNTANENDIAGPSGSKPPVLGLRDLVKMHKAEKIANKKSSHPTSISPISPRTVEIRDELPPSYPGSMGINDQEVFAKQVIIKGYKIVGGGDWKDVAKLGAYVVYEIDVSLKYGGNIEILRRYTDFVNLRNALKIKYPTLKDAIPPLPGKAHFSKFSPEFLEQRQPRLQRFLRSVVLHPEMGKGGEGSIVGNWVMGKGG